MFLFGFPTRPRAPGKLGPQLDNLCVASTGMAPATQHMCHTRLLNCQVDERTESDSPPKFPKVLSGHHVNSL